MSDADTLPGLLTASWRGIEFFSPDTSTLPGRRVAESLFPGIDQPAYEDFGEAPEEVTVYGMVLGDDYITQALALRDAFRTAGPGTLVHPWLGAMTAILPEPAEITFSASELRVARFSASFKRIDDSVAGAIVSTAAALLGAATATEAAAAALAGAPATVTLSAVQSLASVSSAAIAGDIWTSVTAGTAAAVAMKAVADRPA